MADISMVKPKQRLLTPFTDLVCPCLSDIVNIGQAGGNINNFLSFIFLKRYFLRLFLEVSR